MNVDLKRSDYRSDRLGNLFLGARDSPYASIPFRMKRRAADVMQVWLESGDRRAMVMAEDLERAFGQFSEMCGFAIH